MQERCNISLINRVVSSSLQKCICNRFIRTFSVTSNKLQVTPQCFNSFNLSARRQTGDGWKKVDNVLRCQSIMFVSQDAMSTAASVVNDGRGRKTPTGCGLYIV